MSSRDATLDGARLRARKVAGEHADGMVGYEKWGGFEHDGDRWAPTGHVYLKTGATPADAVARLFGAEAVLLEPGAPEPEARADRRAPCPGCGVAAGMHRRDPARSFETVLCDGARLIL
ncbi:MAG: hypothetical protein EKK55_10460 [Rhodocyclaceae bacterium]|nr:MAG: hypothetical protein EKK55_10460 [Rhodocyclaceae bacterium]